MRKRAMDFKVYTKQELYEKYGYLMNNSHIKDIQLLINIMQDNGLSVVRIGSLFVVNKQF